MSMRLIISKLIKTYGQECQLKKRIVNTIDHQIVYDYSEPELIKGQFLQIMPYDSELYAWGNIKVGDWIGCFPHNVNIEEGDLIILSGDTLEVQNVICRRHKGKVMYKEALLRRKSL